MTTSSDFSVLVIDDEPDLRTLYELTLLREGYNIETAGSVEDALLQLKDRRFNAVISDMRLPDGTGLDVLRHLEENHRPEKTIVITAYGSAENAVEALKAGAYDYLTKPVDLKQFRAVVASALGRNGAMAPPVIDPTQLPSEKREEKKEEKSSEPAAINRVMNEKNVAAQQVVAKPASTAVAAAPRNSEKTAVAAAAAEPRRTFMQRMAGQSQAMQQVRSLVEKVARSMAPVLVNGESGTGKELVARAIHESSPRGAHRFMAVNCGAIPEQLLEAEFFGYRKGAFTGANEDREGFFQAANGGTLFLDEIGDLPLSMQSKLLRVIQERSVRPVGAVQEQTVNVRLLSATHKDLSFEVQEGRFRQDLYYRLNVIQIRVPPLRERLEDLREITLRLLERIANDAGISPPPHLTPQALVHLSQYGFPGNVRELENLLHRAVALSGEVIDVLDLGLSDVGACFSEGSSPRDQAAALPASFEKPLASTSNLSVAAKPLGSVIDPTNNTDKPSIADLQEPLPTDLAAYLDETERDILIRALEQHGFNRTAAGASMGLSLRQMRYRMARLNITEDGDPAE
jgi:two-component system, NtrC family, response regulator PilR